MPQLLNFNVHSQPCRKGRRARLSIHIIRYHQTHTRLHKIQTQATQGRKTTCSRPSVRVRQQCDRIVEAAAANKPAITATAIIFLALTLLKSSGKIQNGRTEAKKKSLQIFMFLVVHALPKQRALLIFMQYYNTDTEQFNKQTLELITDVW